MSTLDAESIITLNVKKTISEAKEDSIVLGSAFVCVVALIITFYLMRQDLVVEARQQAADVHYGADIKSATSLVNDYLDYHQQILERIKSQSIKSNNPDQLEQFATSVVPDAEAIYVVDADLQRHKQLGFAAQQMVRATMRGDSVSPRAVKIAKQWKILISGLITERESQEASVVLLQLPVESLQAAMAQIDSTKGLIELQQTVPNRSNIVLTSFGERGSEQTQSATNPQIFATDNSFWQLYFTPSQALADTINKQLPPFWLYFGAIVCGVIIALYLLTLFRIKRRQTITAIFIENHNAEDALFAPALDAHEDPNKSKIVDAPIESAPLVAETAQGLVEPHSESTPLTKEDSPLNKGAATEEDPLIEEEPTAQEEPATEKEPAAEEKPTAEQETKVIALSELPNNIDDPNFKVPDRVFRDYDIRGIAGDEITPEFASRLGKTIGTIILNNGHSAIYVGRDGRLTSNQLSQALQQGLLSTGCHVIDLGEITTPILNFAVHHSGQSSCGIMVTASHNPAHYNGFKVIIKGQVIAGPILQLIKPMLDKAEFTRSDDGQRYSRDIVTQYVRHIVEESTIARSFTVVVDAGNAVAGPVALKLFESLGHTLVPLYCDVDGAFPNHEPNPADENNLQALIEKVVAVNADLGFAFDGDGDRVVVISSSGEIIWPDKLMMIFARDILASNPDTDIVFDVKSSKRLAELIREHKGRPMMCKTGHAHVRKAVQHNNAPLGGEFSGHIFFNDRWKGFDDGIYAAVRLLEILSNQKDHATVDRLVAEFKASSYTPEILIAVDEDEKFELINNLVAGCQFKGAQIITLDGMRVEYPDGWGLIRASNTTANLTLRFEADDDKGLEAIKQRFRIALAPFINQIEEYI